MCAKAMSAPTQKQILAARQEALSNSQFIAYYQPQYNHSTGMLLGAEALVRWQSPDFGFLAPYNFIPLFEEDGFISQIDLTVFEQVCQFQRSCIENGFSSVPISVNLSVKDLFQENFLATLEEIRQRYDVPVRYLRLELTESAAAQSMEQVRAFLAEAHALGYLVEMDDFGSGYSSLNVLKDLDFDIIKLDMNFLVGDTCNGRGGTIVSSVVRMCKWLRLPVIAEGVETLEQADFMKSVGCNYLQGYLYSKPIPVEDFKAKLQSSTIGQTDNQFDLISSMDSNKFWSPESLETLIFSNYVGAAAIFEYRADMVEILRMNPKFQQELGVNITNEELFTHNVLHIFDEENKKVFVEALEKAIETNEEQECETWVTVHTGCCGEEHLCFRINLRKIGQSPVGTMFYTMIRNITAEKQRYTAILDSERRFKMASEQVNIYYWEYTVATKEMRPCFRCMRDLGLPALVTNYPEPAIEAGIFPPEVADMYRDWHRQIAEGVPSLEAVIPLTVGRVPFLVRYTTEFDDFGRPIKAYGSAALVVDTPKQDDEEK